MIRKQALRCACTFDPCLEVGVPPHVIDVDGDPEPILSIWRQLIAQRVGLRERVHARAISSVHRVQRLDRERHPCRLRVLQQFADAIAHHFACAAQVFRDDAAAAILGQAADDQDEATRAERQRLIDRAPVVIER